MIDVHCHLLPGIDDGAPDDTAALAMARIAFADGIRTTVCTPHIYPGLYENDADGIRRRTAELQRRLVEEGIGLVLAVGADAHLTPELLSRLQEGTVPTLAGGRYVLLEPPHHVAPPRFAESMWSLVAAGFVPVLTHPERLTWIGQDYAMLAALVHAGVWMQVTAGSLAGRFGSGARYFAERMLDDGLVHLLATDAHGVKHRAPLLAEGLQVRDVLVVIDREQGGKEELARNGLTLHALASLTQVLEALASMGRVSQEQAAQVRRYLQGS